MRWLPFALLWLGGSCTQEVEVLESQSMTGVAGAPALPVGSAGAGGAESVCHTDDDCAAGLTWCSLGRCVPCSTEECPPGWEVVPRNGCNWCVPPRECADDVDCRSGTVCYPGAACLPGCVDGPRCCHGNVCAAPGCPPASELDCALVGCEDGAVCSLATQAPRCICSRDGTWTCSPPSSNFCEAR